MIRNNLLALLIHTLNGIGLFILSGALFEFATTFAVLTALVLFYLFYFVLAFLFARTRLFNRRRNKLYHVLLPSVVMAAFLVALYAIDFSTSSAAFGYLVGIWGQPVEFILAVTGNRMEGFFSLLTVVVQCLIPAPLIWLGLAVGGKGKLDAA
jgi:hypothetical protein